jgi:metal-responsive CopG/Arc/MetJ family transcriptional regulator
MKTAISIPDELFTLAEITAKKLGIPRSQLFARALEEFIENHSNQSITEKLNKIYPNTSEHLVLNSNDVGINLLRESLKNDSW